MRRCSSRLRPRRAGSCTLARAPAGYSAHVTGGAASGISLATVACMCLRGGVRGADGDSSGVAATARDAATAQLPDTAAFSRTEVVVDGGSDTRWLGQVALTGATRFPYCNVERCADPRRYPWEKDGRKRCHGACLQQIAEDFNVLYRHLLVKEFAHRKDVSITHFDVSAVLRRQMWNRQDGIHWGDKARYLAMQAMANYLKDIL